MLSFTSFVRPVISSFSASVNQIAALRFASKTHRATYKRWRKTATGFKRGIQGRKHGNAGFAQSILKKRTGTAYSTHTQSKILQRLLPNM
jgi:ribosomal protein L35